VLYQAELCPDACKINDLLRLSSSLFLHAPSKALHVRRSWRFVPKAKWPSIAVSRRPSNALEVYQLQLTGAAFRLVSQLLALRVGAERLGNGLTSAEVWPLPARGVVRTQGRMDDGQGLHREVISGACALHDAEESLPPTITRLLGAAIFEGGLQRRDEAIHFMVHDEDGTPVELGQRDAPFAKQAKFAAETRRKRLRKKSPGLSSVRT
jgi:hypothetical protein